MADEAKKRAEILMMAEAQGKTLKPEHQRELERYRDAGVIPQPKGKTRILPETAAKKLRDGVTSYSGLTQSLNGFQDAYAGNTFTGGLESWLQSRNSSIGTPGQREWWARFQGIDNVIRNDLFGAALTATEKASYERTTISPNMDPAEIRKNLAQRAEIIRGAMSREVGYLRANKYEPDAIDALAGEYAADFSPDYTPPANPTDPGGEVKFKDEQSPEDKTLVPLTPEQKTAYDTFMGSQKKGELTADRLRAFYQGLTGRSHDSADAVVDHFNKTGEFASAEGTVYRDPQKEEMKKRAETDAGKVDATGAAAFGLADDIPFADELGGIADTVGLTPGRPNMWEMPAGEAFNYNSDLNRMTMDEIRGDHPIAYTAGQVGGLIAGGYGLTRAAPAAAGWMNRGSDAAKLGKSLTMESAYGGFQGAGAGNENRLSGGMRGAYQAPLGSLAGRTVMRGTRMAVAPEVDDSVRLLRDKGVRTTFGQSIGPKAAAVEEKLQSVPIVGDLIRTGRGRALKDFNRAVINEALAPLGKKLPEDADGTKAMAFAQAAFDEAYGQARSGMQFVPDDDFLSAVTNLARRADDGELSEAAAKRLKNIIKSQVSRKVGGGPVSGETYKEMHSRLAKLASGARQSDPELSSAISELQSHIDDAARRASPPEAVAAMDAADKGYSQLVRAEAAAAMRKGETGTFTPAQLDATVQRMDGSVRSKAYLRGDAVGQKMAEAGKNILRDQVPDSGTAGRLALGGGAMAAGYIEPTGTAALTAGTLAAPYLPVIRDVLPKLVAGRRGKTGEAVGNLIRKNYNLGGAVGIPLALGYGGSE